MHVEGDKYNTGALVQKYEAGIKGFFKDEDLVSLVMKIIFFNWINWLSFKGERVQETWFSERQTDFYLEVKIHAGQTFNV